MKNIIIAFSLIFGFNSLNAQVGIGNLDPDTTSILDLSNNKGKGLKINYLNNYSQIKSTPGLTYIVNKDFYFVRTDGIISLSPWKFKYNGNQTNDLFFNGGNINIGSSDINIIPEAPLQIERLNNVNLVNNGSLLIGVSDSLNIAFNNNKIQTRNTASSSVLNINKSGGDVILGSNSSQVNLKINGSIKELHHPTNEYYDLIPAGLIIMWYGDTNNIPTGWALCNGQVYTKANNTGSLQSPDLRGRFVVGAGDNGYSSYNPYNTGGQDSVSLSADELPAHSHNVRDIGHSHYYYYASAVWGDGDDDAKDNSFVDSQSTVGDYTSTAISPMTEDYKGGNKPHENRPPFYTLVYIMKL